MPQFIRDRVARALLLIAAAGALGAVFTSAETLAEAPAALKVTAAHDLASFTVYAGLFVLLTWRPRGLPGVGELLIIQKLVFGIAVLAMLRNYPDAMFVGSVDVALAILLTAAYVLARGDLAWPRRDDEPVSSIVISGGGSRQP